MSALEEEVFVSVNGQVSCATQARLSPLDRGFLHGEAIYEVFIARRGRPLFWDEHWARLNHSADQAGFGPLSPDLEGVLLREIARTGQHLRAERASVRLVLSSGPDGLQLDAPAGAEPTRVIVARPLAAPPEALYERGCVLQPVQVSRRGRRKPLAKRTARPDTVQERAAAQRVGAYEALRIDEHGRALEGSTSNFFAVIGGELRTAPLNLGVLKGVTRSQVLRLARGLGLTVRVQAVHEADFGQIEEAFITSSTRGVLPVARIGAQAIALGSLTAQIARAYAAHVEAKLAPLPEPRA